MKHQEILQLPNDVKIIQTPRWLIWLPFVPRKIAFAIAPYIFLPKRQYIDYLSDNVSAETHATIAHEMVHVRRERQQGVLWFGVKYLFSKKFCFNEEIYAITEQMKACKQNNIEFDTDHRARMLAGPIYRHCTTYDHAKKVLDDIWCAL